MKTRQFKMKLPRLLYAAGCMHMEAYPPDDLPSKICPTVIACT